MSVASCPVSRTQAGPFNGRGCAWSGYGAPQQTLYTPHGSTAGSESPSYLYDQERKTITDLLHDKPLTKLDRIAVKNIDHYSPPDVDVLAAALGAPARRVLLRAEQIGPQTGWKDGYLSSKYGFCAPDPSASPIALSTCPGRIWSDIMSRMPAIVSRGRVREEVASMPLIHGTSDIIPDAALWAATTCLTMLATVYRYEEGNDGFEGVATTASSSKVKDPDDEVETKGFPKSLAIPLRQICERMGRPLPHMATFDCSLYNYKIRDPTAIEPYVERRENMDLRWPIFNDNSEHATLLCFMEVHGACNPIIEAIARCQELVMLKDNEGLLRQLIKIKTCVDRLAHVFHKISVNPNAGENYANPVVWGQRFAKWTAPLSKRVPALSGLHLPLFMVLDVFLGRTKYDSFLGKEFIHLRAWQPMNIRAFIAAIEYDYKVPDYIMASNDPCLKGVLNGIVEAYAGERGFMGTHRYKIYGFLEIAARSGRSGTNGNSGAEEEKPWVGVHKALGVAMLERLDPYRLDTSILPENMRGCFEECRFTAQILSRRNIDQDVARSTGLVTFDLQDTGITFQPGDRLAVMPMNAWSEVAKIAAALGLEDFMEMEVPLDLSPEWNKFAKHIASVKHIKSIPKLSVRDILRRGHLAPLTKDLVLAFHVALRGSSTIFSQVLASDTWPVRGSLGDLLQAAAGEATPELWDEAFDLSDSSWLPRLIPLEVPRTYSISNFSNELLPSIIDLCVSRSEFKNSPLVDPAQREPGQGVSSGFLNPNPLQVDTDIPEEEEVLIGLSRPLNFQLPISEAAPIAMFAGGSGIAPFRGFWQARAQSQKATGRNLLFLGVQSREKFVFEDELRDSMQNRQLEVHVAFSRDRRGLVYDPEASTLVERTMEPRYIDAVIMEQGKIICDLVMGKDEGGLGGYLYVCGSVSVYETVIAGIKRAMYQSRNVTPERAEQLVGIAFAERRFMLDIFMSPQPVSYNQPTISVSQLALNAGHRADTPMWLGVHGSVYDIREFLPIHPGGPLIAAAAAGQDASEVFDELAHTSNPEVMSLLSKYFIGHMTPKPEFNSIEITEIYDLWRGYLKSTVECLTNISFEVKDIMEDCQKTWFNKLGELDSGGLRKMYQFQSRFMQGGLSVLFGAKLQELYLKLSFVTANYGSPNERLPDVMGTINRVQNSATSVKVSKEVGRLGELVCNVGAAQFYQNGILKYAQKVTELDLLFLEQVRSEACLGMDAFDVIDKMKGTMEKKQRLMKLSSYLISILERVSERLEAFYSSLARESIYSPELELNPARTRWNILRRQIFDGSFFMLSQTSELDPTSSTAQYRSSKQKDHDVDFDTIIAQTKHAMVTEQQVKIQQQVQEAAADIHGPRRLAHTHTERASNNNQSSSFDAHVHSKAMNRISRFLDTNSTAIRRLSRMPTNFNLAQATAMYGGEAKPTPLARNSIQAMQTAARQARAQAEAAQSNTRARTAGTSIRPLLLTQAQVDRFPGSPKTYSPSASIHSASSGSRHGYSRSGSSVSSAHSRSHSRSSSTSSARMRISPTTPTTRIIPLAAPMPRPAGRQASLGSVREMTPRMKEDAGAMSFEALMRMDEQMDGSSRAMKGLALRGRPGGFTRASSMR